MMTAGSSMPARSFITVAWCAAPRCAVPRSATAHGLDRQDPLQALRRARDDASDAGPAMQASGIGAWISERLIHTATLK